MEMAKMNRRMPPAICNAARGMFMALRIISPATEKNTRIAAATAMPTMATRVRMPGSSHS
jgi:hypothetical protein